MKDILTICLLFIMLVLFYPLFVSIFPVDLSVSIVFIIPTLLLIALWYQTFRRKEFFWKLHRLNLLTLSFGGFILLSLIGVFHSVYFYGSMKAWSALLNGFLLFLITANYQLKTLHEPEIQLNILQREFKDRLLWIFFAMGCLQSIWGIYQYTLGFERQLGDFLSTSPQLDARILSGIRFTLESKRITGSLGNPNLFAIMVGLCIPSSLGLLFLSKTMWKRILLLAGTAFMGIAIFLSASRGGMIALIGGLAVFIIMAGYQYIKKNYLLIGILLALVVAGTLLIQKSKLSPNIESLSTRIQVGTSTIQERIYYWDIALKMIKDRPLLGGGLASYGTLYGQYKPPKAGESRYAHNTFLQVWTEGGFLVFLAFMFFLGTILIYPILHGRKIKRPDIRIQWASFYSGMLVFLLDSFVGYAFYWPDLWYAACVLLGGCFATLWAERVPEPTAHDILWRRQPNTAFLLITPAVTVVILIYWFSWIYPDFQGELYYLQGRSALSQGRPELAVPAFKKAVQKVPYQSNYQQHLGMTLGRIGMVQEGSVVMEKAVRLNPYTAYLHADLSDLYLQAGDLNKARSELQKAISCYPEKKVYQKQLDELNREFTP